MKKLFKKIPYTHRIALVILIFSLLPCVLLEIIYIQKTQQERTESVLLDYQNIVDSNALLLSKNLSAIQSKMEYVLNNSSIRSGISQINNLSLVQTLDFINLLDETVKSVTADDRSLVIRWYPYLSTASYGNHCYTLDIFANEFTLGSEDPCYLEIMSLTGKQTLWKTRDISRAPNNTGPTEPRLCIYTKMTNLNGSNCIVEFSTPIDQMPFPLGSDNIPNSLFAICLNQGNEPLNIFLNSFLTKEDANALITRYQQTSRDSEFDIIHAPIPNIVNSEVVFFIPSSYTQEFVRPQIIILILASVLIIFMIISASYLTSHLLTKHIVNTINTINDDLKHVVNEPFHSDFVQDNIDQISLQVKKLIRNTQEYYAQLEHYEAENLRMELELLQMRFNPHLLYNTLGAIRHQVKNYDARNSIDSMCRYYRIVLNNGHLIIKLKDEFEMIKEYLSIEKFAYSLENIEFDFYLEKQIENHGIIKHLLQPIVENALHHGLRPAPNGGIIRIYATENHGTICITIQDNGVGMISEDTCKLLTEPQASVFGHGYGIYNVQQRVQVYYGKEYGLHIQSTIGEGTTVTLNIPANQ